MREWTGATPEFFEETSRTLAWALKNGLQAEACFVSNSFHVRHIKSHVEDALRAIPFETFLDIEQAFDWLKSLEFSVEPSLELFES